MSTNNKKIEIVVSVYNFQKRFCWQLSSLLKQSNKEDFIINVNYLKNDKSDIKIADLLDVFEKRGLNIRRTEYDSKEVFEKRGNTRQNAYETSSSEWLYFTDADMVFEENYFEILTNKLNNEYKNEERMLTQIRYNLLLEDVEKTLNVFEYPLVVENIYDLVKNMRTERAANVLCVGYCQIIKKEVVKKHGGYIDVNNNPDVVHENNGGYICRSDKILRKKTGKLKMKNIPNIFHIRHSKNIKEMR
jgi:folate-dependent phosphoribosylglycinamide formyltransferase PurN